MKYEKEQISLDHDAKNMIEEQDKLEEQKVNNQKIKEKKKKSESKGSKKVRTKIPKDKKSIRSQDENKIIRQKSNRRGPLSS